MHLAEYTRFLSSARIFTSGTKKSVRVQPEISGPAGLSYNSNTTALPQQLCHASVPHVQGTKAQGASLENTPQQTCRPWHSALRIQRQRSLPSTEHHSSTWQPPKLAVDNQQPRLRLPRDLLPVSQDTMLNSAHS